MFAHVGTILIYTRCSIETDASYGIRPTTVAVKRLYIFFRTISKRDALPPRTHNMHYAASTVWECEIVWRAHDASGAGGCYFVLLLLFLSSVRGIILLYLIGRKPVTPPRVSSPRSIKKYPVLLFSPHIM